MNDMNTYSNALYPGLTVTGEWRIKQLCLAVEKYNAETSRVFPDERAGLSSPLAMPNDTVISGGNSTVRDAVTAQFIRSYGANRAVVLFHCGNEDLERKLTLSSFAFNKGGTAFLPSDPIKGLDRDSVRELLTGYLKFRNCWGEAETEALDDLLSTAYSYSDPVTLKNLHILSALGPAKLLISLHGNRLIGQEELDERLEALDGNTSGFKTVRNCIAELARIFDADKAENIPSVHDIIRSGGILCVDLHKIGRAKDMLFILISVISEIADHEGCEPLLVFDSVHRSFAEIVEESVAARTLRIFSGGDMTVCDERLGKILFASDMHRIFLRHSGQSADRVSAILGEYSGYIVETSYNRARRFTDLFPVTTVTAALKLDEHRKRVASPTVSKLHDFSVIFMEADSSDIIITRAVSVI